MAELNIVEARSDLVVVQDSLLEPFLNKLLEFLDVRERDFDGEHRPRLSRAGWTGAYLLRHVKGRSRRLPGSLARGGDVIAEARTLEEISTGS